MTRIGDNLPGPDAPSRAVTRLLGDALATAHGASDMTAGDGAAPAGSDEPASAPAGVTAGTPAAAMPAMSPADASALTELWGHIAKDLRTTIGAKAFDHWLKHVKPCAFDSGSGRLWLSAPSQFTGEQIASRFADRLRLAWQQLLPSVAHICMVAADRGVRPVLPARAGAPVVAGGLVADLPPAQAPNLDARLTFATFVQGRSNILALGAARRMAAVEAPSFRPLYLRGETGQGKTHLLHAIAAATLARQPAATIILMSAERFMTEFVTAMRANDMMAFKARLRAADLLLIDDLQFIVGKASTQIELLHTIDEVLAGGGRLVVAADRPPHRLEGIEQRLQSRLAGGLVADIDAPDRDLRVAILERKGALIDARVPPEVIDWIANRFVRNIRELEGALNKLAAYAALADFSITLETAQQKLAESADGTRPRITIDDIQRAVCAHFRMDRAEMASQRRVRAVARPRQIAMYLAKELTPRSFPEIGRRFGGRDHSTVIHAVRTIEALRVADADLDRDIRQIRSAINA